MKMTPKQEAFCREYVIDFNATQAAIRSGYSEKTAGAVGFENLKKPEIQKKVEELKAAATQKAEVSVQDVLCGIRTIAEDEGATNRDKLKAWELLGRYNGMFTDRIESRVQQVVEEKGTPEEYAKKVAEATREIMEMYRRKDEAEDI